MSPFQAGTLLEFNIAIISGIVSPFLPVTAEAGFELRSRPSCLKSSHWPSFSVFDMVAGW